MTVIGHDRPGIVAEVAEVLAQLGLNLTDSTMTRLRGHFAMTLVCTGEADAARVAEALRPVEADGSLTLAVRPVPPQQPAAVAGGAPYRLSVHGADRLGIVAAVTRALADVGGNITDLTTRLAGDLYVLVAEVDLPTAAEAKARRRLTEVAQQLSVEVDLSPVEADLL